MNVAPEYRVLAEKRLDYGGGGWVRIQRKEVVENGQVRGQFLHLSRGWTTREGVERVKAYWTVPTHPEVVPWLAANLASL